ncbi:DUF4817 domain-containing protein [Trichonephila clavipes]|nr:DUF4817 domain-containing protein [Trichonephila clavipes]
MATSTNKTAAFGVKLIHKCMSKHRYIQKTDCALWAGGIIGPYFFKNDEGHNVTVNGDRYRAMITNFFIPELNNHDVQELWFQQDGATCHTARATIDLLKDTFGDRLISRFGPVNWPLRSCDLTPLDYFLCLKGKEFSHERKCFLIFMNNSDSELSDLLNDDYASDKTYEPRILDGETSSDKSDEEKHGNIFNGKTILDHPLPS